MKQEKGTVRFAKITSPSYVDGPGKRAVIHLQGCSIRCEGCQNQHLWPGEGHGYIGSPQELARLLVGTELPITITGGEPFDQAAGLYTLLWHIHHLDQNRHVIIYSGYTFGELIQTGRFEILAALTLADVLVDGPYVREQDDPMMQYRGSRNQRVIDLPATFRQPALDILFNCGPILLDWDEPEIIITDTGDLLGASPLISGFSPIGEVCSTRRCGEI
jgi:anaerobic ribonucleoside-triphosphate reductase activating protein